MSNYKTIEEMIQGQAYEYPEYYHGPDNTGTFYLVSQGRDSDALTRSNFECILNDLRKIAVEDVDFVVQKDGHWACGWVESVLVNIENKPEILEFCLKVFQELHNYPVYNDDDFYALEREEFEERYDFEISCQLHLIGTTPKLDHDLFRFFMTVGFENEATFDGCEDAWFDYRDTRNLDQLFDPSEFEYSILSEKFIEAMAMMYECGLVK